MAPLPHDRASQLEAGRFQSWGEKASSELVQHHNSRLRPARSDNSSGPAERMPSAGRLFLALLVSFLVTFGLATALSPGDWHRRPYQRGGEVVRHNGVRGSGEDGRSLTELLDAASPSSLHDLLHKYFPERFKDGVWESDVSAVEAVRRVDAALAASIVQLAKRADNATTTTTTTPPPTTSPTTTTTMPPVTTPPPDDGSSTTTTEPTTTPPLTTPTTSNAPSSTTSAGGSSSTTGPASSTSSRPASTSTNRPTTSPGTPNPITNRPTSPSFTTSRPVTSTFTSTKDDGGVIIVTTTSWVSASPQMTDSSTSTRPTPSLQNAAPAGRNHHAPAALFRVVVVVGAALLI